MSRRRRNEGEQRPPPFHISVVTVEAQHRLRFSRELSLLVGWLGRDAPTTKCVACLGPFGGLHLRPAGETVDFQRAGIASALQRRPPLPHEVAEAWTELARYIATAWTVSIQREAGRYSLTLPEDARKLGVAPKAGEVAVIFVAGGILEVWRGPDWVQHVRGIGMQLSDTLPDVMAAIEERAED